MALSRFVLPFADVGSGIKPSDGALLYFFETGTSTPADTFNVSTGGAGNENSNPVVADSTGVFPDIFLEGTFKVRLENKNFIQIWEADPVESDAQDLNAIARSLNVPNSAVIRSTDTTTVLDNVLYIYDASAQVIWSKPDVLTGEFIATVILDQLTTNLSNIYTLLSMKETHNFDVLNDAVISEVLKVGDVVVLESRTSGNKGGSTWDVVLESTVTTNPNNIIACTGNTLLAFTLRIDGDVIINEFGDVGAGDDTVTIQAALAYASSTLKGKVSGVAGFSYVWSVITIPAGVTLSILAAEITVTSYPNIRMQSRSKCYGYGTRYSGNTASTLPYVVADDDTTVTNECEFLGFEMFDTNAAFTARSVDLSSFYQSKFDFSAFGFQLQYIQSGTVQCYYNEITISCTETERGILTQGVLFNGNQVLFKRCNVDLYGGRFDGATGNTLSILWIEGVGSGQNGLRLISSTKTTIIGGTIEDITGAVAGISLEGTTSETCIVNTEFGGEFANSGRKVTATSGVIGTTILNADENYLSHDGVITNVGGGTGNRVNVGSLLATEPTVLAGYTVAGVPSAVGYDKGMIMVTDEVGGEVPAFSDGANWRRVTDRAIVSV